MWFIIVYKKRVVFSNTNLHVKSLFTSFHGLSSLKVNKTSLGSTWKCFMSSWWWGFSASWKIQMIIKMKESTIQKRKHTHTHTHLFSWKKLILDVSHFYGTKISGKVLNFINFWQLFQDLGNPTPTANLRWWRCGSCWCPCRAGDFFHVGQQPMVCGLSSEAGGGGMVDRWKSVRGPGIWVSYG